MEASAEEVSPEDKILIEAGFEVVREGVTKTYFKTPMPVRRRMYKIGDVSDFIQKEHKAGRLLHISIQMFIFSKRKYTGSQELRDNGKISRGSQRSTGGRSQGRRMGGGDMEEVLLGEAGDTIQGSSQIGGMMQVHRSQEQGARMKEQGGQGLRDVVDKMVKLQTKDPDVMVDHRKEVASTANLLDALISEPLPNMSNEHFEIMKRRLEEATDMDLYLGTLHADPAARAYLLHLYMDIVITEITEVDSKVGPLSEFPPNINANFYTNIIKFGLNKCPVTLSLMAHIRLRHRKTVLSGDVLAIANNFGNLLYMANKNLDGLIKLRSLTLQAGGATVQCQSKQIPKQT